MPVQFLTDAEREHLMQFPATLTFDDLITYFTLGDADLTYVHTHRGATNRLGVALQVGMLCYLGYWPADVTRVPEMVVDYVAQQVGVPPASLAAYGQRAHTRTDHQHYIARYLGFRSPDMWFSRTWRAMSHSMQHPLPEQIKVGAPEHLSLNKLDPVHVPFDGARTPWLLQRRLDGAIILPYPCCKRLEFGNPTGGTGSQPPIEHTRRLVPYHSKKLVC